MGGTRHSHIASHNQLWVRCAIIKSRTIDIAAHTSSGAREATLATPVTRATRATLATVSLPDPHRSHGVIRPTVFRTDVHQRWALR